jgi:hypothetical protein
MELLEATLFALSEKQLSGLRSHLGSTTKAKKEKLLFDLLCRVPQLTHDQLLAKLQSKPNANAYHSLRKRLTQKVMDYLVFVQLANSENVASESAIYSYLALAEFFIGNQQNELALRFLQKALVVAEKRELFDGIDHTYTLLIKHAVAFSLDPRELISAWEANQQRKNSHQRLIFSNSMVQHAVAQAKRKGEVIDPETLTASLLQSAKLPEDAQRSPKFMLQLVNSLRAGVKHSKDYFAFEHFVVKVYAQLDNANAFQKEYTSELFGFLYILAHVHYRNRKFDVAEKYLSQLNHMYQSHKSRLYYTKYAQLRAATASFGGRNEEAIVLLEHALKSLSSGETEDRLNMQLNLCVYFFQAGQFKKALRTLALIQHSGAWLEKKMGVEWRFKKELIELIVHCELGNSDLALARLQAMSKHFSSFLEHPTYQRARLFLSFVKIVLLRPEYVASPEFANEVENANMGLPDHQEDIQAITFFCWLKAKMIGRVYYEVLLESMSASPE